MKVLGFLAVDGQPKDVVDYAVHGTSGDVPVIYALWLAQQLYGPDAQVLMTYNNVPFVFRVVYLRDRGPEELGTIFV